MKTLKDLKYCMVHVAPVNRDWSEGYPEKWDYFAASKCEDCGEIFFGRNGDRHSEFDARSACDGHVPENDGPMMNYSYALPDFNVDAQHAAKLLVDLPLVLVYFEDSDEWPRAPSFARELQIRNRMNTPSWSPGSRARCINPAGTDDLRYGRLYLVNGVHASDSITYLTLAPEVSGALGWNAARFELVTPRCDRVRNNRSANG